MAVGRRDDEDGGMNRPGYMSDYRKNPESRKREKAREKARSRAKTRLAQQYPSSYQELYSEELRREGIA
jgi:hypothetical protein